MPDLIINGKLFEGVEKLAFDTEDGEKAYYVLNTENSNETWYFNDTITQDNVQFFVKFKVDDVQYYGMDYDRLDNGLVYVTNENHTEWIVVSTGWPPYVYDQYRTVVFNESVDLNSEFGIWLSQNATKITQ